MRDKSMASSSKTFRIFVSSTFADLAEERNALQSSVFPRLRALCEQSGARFSPVDLRWGVSTEAGEDQRTMFICLQEIRRCQQTTPRPNFIVLLAERYGWQPLPAEIPVADFERLQTTPALQKSVGVFGRLYPAIDLNAVPNVYCLRPRTVDLAEWETLERELLQALHSACLELGWSFNEQARYGGSATEQEIVTGLFREDTLNVASEHVHAFLINNRDEEPHAPSAARLHDLKRRLRAALRENVHEYEIGAKYESRSSHTEKLSEDVYTALEHTIGEELDRLAQRDPLDREIEAHDNFAAERDKIFIGRSAVLRQIENYVASDQAHVFALLGPSGSGKSSALAHALAVARRERPNAVVVARFIGTTAESSTGVTLLNSLSREIARIYGGTVPPAYAEYPTMAAVFRDNLKLALTERPLILFLDALDQLPASDAARNLSWLSLDALPPNVRLLVSASSDSPGPAGVLQQKIPPERRARLDPMPAEEAGALLNLWLKDAGRDLQREQRELLMTAFRASGLPLYLRFAFEQARLWHSFDRPETIDSDIHSIICQTLAGLADPANHGHMLVERSLGYLTAAKEGLTEDEMLDLLSADGAVMQDFRNRFPNSPKADYLPLVIWSRLYYDLRAYLTERGGMATAVLTYFHRQMREVATSQYLDTTSERERHQALALYFQSKPNSFGRGVYHTRKLSELPYQLRKSAMWEELESTLCDLSFIEAKCAAGLIYDLLADYDAAILTAGLPDEKKQRISSFGRFVRAQARLLSTHPHLTFQQALNQPDVTAPARSASLLASAERRPRFRWINKPQRTSACILTLYGHTSYVNACDVSPDGTRIASASSDEEIKIWNAGTGREELTLRGRPISAESCAFSPDGARIVSATRDGQVLMWDAMTGGELWFVKVHERPVPSCRFSADGKRIVTASWDGKLKVLDGATGAEVLSLAGHGGDACWAEFSLDGSRIISVGGDGKLKSWDSATGHEVLSAPAHQLEIMTCRFSRDGTSIFTASQDTLVKRWDAATFELQNTYEGHEEGVWAAAVSADGTRLVTAGRDGSIKLWDVESGAELGTMREHTNEVWGLAFFANGSRFVSAAWDGTVKVWDLKTAEEGSATQQKPLEPSTERDRYWGYMIACSCSPDGATVAAGSSDGTLRLWDAASGLGIGVFPIHRDFIFACSFSPDSRWIVSGAWDGALKIFDVRERREVAAASLPATIVFCTFIENGRAVAACCGKEIQVWDVVNSDLRQRVTWTADEPFSSCAVVSDGAQIIAGMESGRFLIWDVATQQTVGELPGHPSLIMFTASRDGRFLAATSEHGMVWVWDISARVELMTLHGHRERVVSCNFSPDSKELVTGSWDRTARIWDLEASDGPIVLEGHTDQLQDCCFTPDGTRIVTVAVDGTVRLWDARSGTALGEFLWPADVASVCVFSPDGEHVATASSRHAIRIWSGNTGQLVRVLSGHEEAVQACAFSSDGKLVSASADGTLRLWDASREGPGSIIGRHQAPVSACAFSSDGRWIASAAQDRRLKLWDLETRAEFATFEGHDDWVRMLLIVAGDKRIASCSLDKTARIWDSSNGQLLRLLRGHQTAISAAAASLDGSRLVTGSEDGNLFVWDIENGRQELTLSGHKGAIRACAFAGSIVSASRDGTLRLWDPATGALRAELQEHTGPVQACAVSPDLRYVVSASEDRFVMIWDLVSGKRLAEYWAGNPVLSVSWHPESRRVAVGDAMGMLHLLEFE